MACIENVIPIQNSNYSTFKELRKFLYSFEKIYHPSTKQHVLSFKIATGTSKQLRGGIVLSPSKIKCFQL